MLGRRSPIPVDLQVHVNERLPGPVEVSAYYLVAEALTNAAKHARASTVSVQIEVVGDSVLLLAVRDDGAGFVGADLTGGTGLVGLKDRVEALGGRIILHSPRGAGTSLRVELPLTASTALSLPPNLSARLTRHDLGCLSVTVEPAVSAGAPDSSRSCWPVAGHGRLP